MSEFNRFYILGAGAIGLSLAVHLVRQGRQVTAVRTSVVDQPRQNIEITLQHDGGQRIMAPIETVSLSQMNQMDGMIVVAAKAYANQHIATTLKPLIGSSPIVLLQNGLGVEQPYSDLLFSHIFRCILYGSPTE
jgi:2-dehydropantoate 2-reductase